MTASDLYDRFTGEQLASDAEMQTFVHLFEALTYIDTTGRRVIVRDAWERLDKWLAEKTRIASEAAPSPAQCALASAVDKPGFQQREHSLLLYTLMWMVRTAFSRLLQRQRSTSKDV